jgi:hypothetical protein
MQPRLEKPMADRTDEPKERVAALDSMHDEWLRKMQYSFGRMMGLACKLPGMRWFIEVPFSRLASYLVVDRQTCGEERGCKSDVLDIAVNLWFDPKYCCHCLLVPCCETATRGGCYEEQDQLNGHQHEASERSRDG